MSALRIGNLPGHADPARIAIGISWDADSLFGVFFVTTSSGANDQT